MAQITVNCGAIDGGSGSRVNHLPTGTGRRSAIDVILVRKGMSDSPDNRRSLEQALADLRDKYDRTPENSDSTRRDLNRMANTLEAEIAERASRSAAG